MEPYQLSELSIPPQADDTPTPLRVPISEPAPRLTARALAGGSVELMPEATESSEVWRARFLTAFGTVDEGIAEALLQQLANALCPGKPIDIPSVNLALALLHRIGPRDEIEAMLACQMIVAHVVAMDASRRALHVEQTPGGRQAYLSLTRKLMTLFTAQMDALNRHRGKVTVQKVVVERIVIAPGAQAVVGAVSSGRRGDG
jgi:hypothetical protein